MFLEKSFGYVQNIQGFEETVKENIVEHNNKNIYSIAMEGNTKYELKFVDRTIDTKEEEAIETMEQKADVTYKYYEVSLGDNVTESVNTIEQAQELITKIEEQNQDKSMDLSISEKYTNNENEVNTKDVEIAKNNIQIKVEEEAKQAEIQRQEAEKKEQQEKENNQTTTQKNQVVNAGNGSSVKGIKIACAPVSGTISSRYGASSRIRKSNHTGLDIAARSGTPIKAVADGTVVGASYQGSYGNLVKLSHGNGVESWYAHTSKMNVSVGQKVSAGTVIALVGSTGNSTGAHLHLEIRINGKHVNPQNYLYK